MDRISLKEKAVRLRKQGKTYSEIREILKASIPKGTLSYWCRNIELSQKHQERIKKIILNNAKKGQKLAVASNRVKREIYLKSLSDRNKYLIPLFKNQDVAKIALAMLYLGEGGKWRAHRGLLLGSSDPDIIKIYIKLLRKCYNIALEQMRARVLYRTDQNLKFLTEFWSKTTGIPKPCFYKTKPDPRTKGKKTKKQDYRGVCVITCGGTDIQLELDIIAKMFLRK